MTQQKTTVNGFIRAVADQQHPFQTRLSLILTDFEPNNNKQGIPRAEAENIIRTAPFAPLKINFDGDGYSGHAGARPIGPIINAYASVDSGRDVIAGDAIIWNDMFDDVADHLKVAFAEGVGTSWEIYFESSEKDSNNIEWLQGCVFAGTCVVKTPSYGPNRTRLLAIAEKLHNSDHGNSDDTERLESMSKDKTEETNVAVAADATDVQDLRTDLGAVMDVLSNIYSGIYGMLDQTYELETQLATNDMPAMAEQFTKLIKSVQNRFDSLVAEAQKGQAATAELDQLKTAIAEQQQEKKNNERLQALSDAGIAIAEDKAPFYLSMDDATFETYIADLVGIRKLFSASAESNPIIPNAVIADGDTVSITIKDLAAKIRSGELRD